MDMSTRALGAGGLMVSAEGLGCMGMSEYYGQADDAESLATIRLALDLGVTFFDTADVYGPFKNEELVGRALGRQRSEVVIATKFGIVRDSDGSDLGLRGDAEYARRCCDASLSRLGVDCIDLYYLHRPDPNTPIEESVGAMAELVTAGKVRYLGLSEVPADVLRRACSVHPIAALQSEWSLWTRQIEDEILPTARELGVGLVPYGPLGRAFLTGQITSADTFREDDFRRDQSRFQGENFRQNLRLVEGIARLASDKGCSPGQLALAWLLAQGDDVVPIPGTKRRRFLEENVGALKVVLEPTDLLEIEESFPRSSIAGDR
jgi:aryl-alcohol dehydrogenase-like predicted oxidoreductase